MMFVIVLYDIAVEEKSHGKILKLLRQYLHHVQKSCFHGYLSQRTLRQLLEEIDALNLQRHHIIVYILRSNKYLKMLEIGQQSSKHSNIFGKQDENS